MRDQAIQGVEPVAPRSRSQRIASRVRTTARLPFRLAHPIRFAAKRFVTVWWKNRNEILHLAVINIGVTMVMEALIRSLLTKLTGADQAFAFIVSDEHGMRINQQSLTNVWITGFTSVFGGPVYFLESRLHRYIFFGIFGMIVSATSQCMAGLTAGIALTAVTVQLTKRLAFDIVYNLSFKFMMFEMARGPILKKPPRVSLRIGSIRLAQDFTTTLIRVLFLNLFGLKG